MPPPLLMANWKMNLTVAESCKLAHAIARSCGSCGKSRESRQSAQIVLLPSFTALDAVARIASRVKTLSVGSQDCFWEERGAFTGEESVRTLQELGATFVLIGHSERRQLQNESNEAIRKKVEFVSNTKTVTPVLCIGESHAQKVSGKRKSILQQQLLSAFKGLLQTPLSREIVIAYEPIWAIGTGVSATASDCATIYTYLRGLLENAWGMDAVNRYCRIIYGGSVSEANIADFVAKGVSDGALIGGASLTAPGFCAIIKRVSNSV
ncbi:triose-phosphate isomerase [Candidatus Uhrbacteria bacterium]|nr:triose-phosphate isomerase [Candidatus Uhrbacteria bacterium]